MIEGDGVVSCHCYLVEVRGERSKVKEERQDV